MTTQVIATLGAAGLTGAATIFAWFYATVSSRRYSRDVQQIQTDVDAERARLLRERFESTKELADRATQASQLADLAVSMRDFIREARTVDPEQGDRSRGGSDWQTELDKFESELESLEKGGATLQAATTEVASISSAALFNQYHARSLLQSQISFFFSLGAAVIGFVFIIVAVVVIGLGGRDQASVALVQLLAATIIEVVAALFFRLSNQSRALLIDFFDKLRKDRQAEEALSLAGTMPAESQLAERLTAALTLHLAGADAAVLTEVLAISRPLPVETGEGGDGSR
ncbi:TRADD-N-associated membrane domain-containing protein [Nocardia goodfellowii]